MLGRNAVLALVLLSFTACTTLQPIQDFSPSRIRQQVEVGDEVRIVTLTGATYQFEVTSVEADALQGTADSGKQYKVMFEAIKVIDVEKVSGWKTATGVGATVSTLAVIFVAIIVYFMIDLFEE